MVPTRAWPYGLRRIAACSTPGGSTSSTKQPRPRSRRGSSFLRTGGIQLLVGQLLVVPSLRGPCLGGLLLGGQHLGGQADRPDDVLVARTAAQVAAQRLTNVAVRRPWVVAEQGHGGDQHARGAEAALQPVRIPERLLDRVKQLTIGEALDGGDAGPVSLNGQHQARARRLLVDENGARAAHAVLAAHVGAGQTQLVSEKVAQQQARLDVALVGEPIDLEVDRLAPLRHAGSCPRARAARPAPLALSRATARAPAGWRVRSGHRPGGRGTP